MKIKNILNSSFQDDKIILLGALGLIMANTLPLTEKSVTPEVYEVDSEGNPIAAPKAKSSYISRIKSIMSANNYAPIKTLYKLQGVLDDIALFQTIDFSQNSDASENITEVLSDIKPYLSDTRRGAVNNIADNIYKTRKTFNQIDSVRNKISTLPKDMPRGERLKTIISEIPNISGIPILDNINNIKNILSLIGPKNEDSISIEDAKADGSEKAEYDEIYELVEMFDTNKSKEANI